MATKINPEWWTVPESHTYVAYSTEYFAANFDKFDFQSMSTMDTSIIPWGMGYCAAASTSYVHLEKSGTQWAYNGKLTKNENVVMCKTNNPFALWGGYENPIEGSPWYVDQPVFNWIGAYNVASDTKVYSTADWVTNTVNQGSFEMPTSDKKFRGFKPVVYLDYQNFILRLDSFYIYNKRTHTGVTINSGNFSTWSPPSGTTWDEWEFTGISYTPMYRSGNTWNALNTGSSSSLGNYLYMWNMGEFDTPEDWQNIFYGEQVVNKVAPFQRYKDYIGMEMDTGGNIYTSQIPTEENWQNCNTYYMNYFFASRAGRFVPLKQSFADVSYQQKFLLLDYNGNEITVGNNLPTSTNVQDRIYPRIYYTISDYDGESSKMESWEKIALHELAFYGFPIYNKLHGVSEDGKHIGDEWYYLPDFDYTHMITNGGFFKGADALTKTNATWNDIFDDGMPEYDMQYQPPLPSGGDDGDESDAGQLDNSAYRNIRLGGSNYFYALSEAELHNFINFVNGMYIGDGNDTQMKLDFKGSNPNDYIVGVYAYPFNIPNTTHTSNVFIGPVETSVNANVVKQTDTGYFTFGTLAIEPYYNDFRDYAPYTQIELYIPLCGTVELDAAFYMGHTVTVDGVYDINTGALTVRVLRDNEIDRTFDGSIAVQIPVTARNMGDYQNNIHQLRMNLINASISGITTAEKTLTGGIAQAAQSYGANNPMSGMNVSTLDLFTSPYLAGKGIENAQYKLSHTQPKIAMTSTASTSNAIQMYNKAIMFIKRAKMLPEFDSDSYAHTVGYACCMNKYIGDMSGLTVANNIDISGLSNDGFSPTAEECEMIKQAFSKGVYI